MMTQQRQDRLRAMLQHSRARLMVDAPELALVLMYLRYVATKQVYRISTNGRVIFFDPDWLQKLSGQELDYMLAHQVLHLVREDVRRPPIFAGDRYHHACDIILNSFLYELGLCKDQFRHIGNLPRTTYYPKLEGNTLTPIEAFHAVPFDASTLPAGQRNRYRIDSDEWWGRFTMPEDGILILSPDCKEPDEIVREEEKSGPILHPKLSSFPLSFAGAAGADSTDEEMTAVSGVVETKDEVEPTEKNEAPKELPDLQNDMQPFQTNDDTEALDSAIDRLIHMIESIDASSSKHAQTMERIVHGVESAKLEWRKLLNVFLQEEVCDYSFTPPDHRFSDSDFFLPDFNERESSVKNILFMVDSSGSIPDEMLALVYGEIGSAIEQFNGKMTGSLCFFDTNVTQPIPFCTVGELLRIRPRGYGGTDFAGAFCYVRMHNELRPSCIVLFTDGKGEYPAEDAAAGVPVLWILHGDEKPPQWGISARLEG
ncbi:MAG: hypothetical protein IJT07_02025 [Oscillospiraceae bacterium]|nr:hypothetical protein [Oscillospiraceae bacterium]